MTRHPPGADTPPGSRHLPREADSSIRSTSGRYPSYWNAFLFAVEGPSNDIYLYKIHAQIKEFNNCTYRVVWSVKLGEKSILS